MLLAYTAAMQTFYYAVNQHFIEVYRFIFQQLYFAKTRKSVCNFSKAQ